MATYVFSIDPTVTHFPAPDKQTYVIGKLFNLNFCDTSEKLPSWKNIGQGLPSKDAAIEMARVWLECVEEEGQTQMTADAIKKFGKEEKKSLPKKGS